MCGGAVGDVVDAVDQAPKDAGGGKSATDIVGNPAGNMAFTTPDSTVGKASIVAGGAQLAAPAAAGAQAAAGASAAEGSAAASMPAAAAEGAGVTAGAAGTSGAAATGSDVLGTIKTLAPVVSAGASLIGAGAAYAQAQAASNAPKPSTTSPDRAQVQNPLDPDLTAIRKRNALLFGLDSPGSTDLTKGSAGTGTIGRATLLGG